MNRIRWRSTIAGLAVLAVMATACGSDEDLIETEAAETAYLESFQNINSEAEETLEAAFDAVFVQAEGRAFEQLLPDFSAALGTAISTQEDMITRFEALDVPQKYASDHQRNIQFLQDLIEVLTRQQAASDIGDTELIAQIDIELSSLSRQVFADLSAELAELLTAAPGDAAEIANIFSGLDADEADYLDAVSTGFDEFARRNRSFGAALQRSYSSDELLLRALLDAGAGEAFAAVRAFIVEIDPPSSYADAHELLLAYLDETVSLDTAIGEAAERGDVVGFEVANYGLGLAGARFALEAPPSLVSVISDPVDLVLPDDLPGGPFGESLWQELARFRVLALRQQISSGVFPIVSDENLAAAMAAITPTAIELTEDAIVEIEALAPSAEFAVGHERVLAYLGELLELRRSVLEAATAGDLDTLRKYGELGGFAAERAETELWCAALTDLAEDPIAPITETFFRPFEVRTVDQLCPAA